MSQNIRYREPVVHRSGDLPLKVYHTCYVKYHWHDEYEFLLSDEDGALCTVGGRKIVLNRGDCLMIQGGELHSLSMSLGKSITAIVVHPRLWSGELVGTPPEALEFTAHFVHGTALCGEISALLHRVLDCCREKPPCYEFLLRSYFCALFALLLEAGEYRKKPDVPREISASEAALFDYVHSHLAEPISLDTLASLSHYSKSYIIRLFRKNTGQTPTGYINACRIELAKELLQDKSVTETAFACGFNNLSYFIKVFRKHTGETPMQRQKRGASL